MVKAEGAGERGGERRRRRRGGVLPIRHDYIPRAPRGVESLFSYDIVARDRFVFLHERERESRSFYMIDISVRSAKAQHISLSIVGQLGNRRCLIAT